MGYCYCCSAFFGLVQGFLHYGLALSIQGRGRLNIRNKKNNVLFYFYMSDDANSAIGMRVWMRKSPIGVARYISIAECSITGCSTTGCAFKMWSTIWVRTAHAPLAGAPSCAVPDCTRMQLCRTHMQAHPVVPHPLAAEPTWRHTLFSNIHLQAHSVVPNPVPAAQQGAPASGCGTTEWAWKWVRHNWVCLQVCAAKLDGPEVCAAQLCAAHLGVAASGCSTTKITCKSVRHN